MNIEVEQNVSLAAHTTLKVGGVADYFVTVRSTDELQAALQFALRRTAVRPLILSGGSNVLVSDAGYRGLVIKNEILGREYEVRDDFVVAHFGAGEILDDVIADAVSRQYWGLENLSAIPGSIGATPVQNVGAYGVEISELVVEVAAVNITDGTVRIFSPEECEFSYRDSFFKTEVGRDWCITSVTLNLSFSPKPKLSYGDLATLQGVSGLSPMQVREKVIAIRMEKFPDWTKVGTAGSFFKNPIIPLEQYESLKLLHPDLPMYPVDANQVKIPLGWVLDHICQLRGFTDNGVELFEKQALVLVNRSAKDAAIIDSFAHDIEEKVYKQTGIRIEREVRSI